MYNNANSELLTSLAESTRFLVSDMVFIFTRNILLDTQSQRPKRKLTPNFIGPYRIMRQINSVSFLVEVGKLEIYNDFHLSCHKPAKEINEQHFADREPPPSPPIIVEELPEYEIEPILDHTIRCCQVCLLVK